MKHLILMLALAAPLHAQSGMALLGQTAVPANTVVPAASVEAPRDLQVSWREDGMGRFEAAPGTKVLAPASGTIRITRPARILELHANDGRVISFMTLGTQAAEGPVAEGQEIGTVGDIGFATVLVRKPEEQRTSARSERPDPSKPGIPMIYGGSLAWVQVTSFTVKVRRAEGTAKAK